MNNVNEINQDLQLSDNLCRTCMNVTHGIKSLLDYIEIGSQTFQLKFLLMKCTSIEVVNSDKYSHLICQSCVKQLINFYIFREECFQANVKFEKLYQSTSYTKGLKKLPQSNEIDEREISDSCNVSFEYNRTIELEKHTFDDTVTNENDVLECIDDSLNDGIHTNFLDSKTSDQGILLENKNDASIFSCAQCRKIFRSKYGLSAHIKIHLDLKNSKCEICGKQFTRIADVKRHMVTHTGVKPFTCKICNASFTQSGSLATHIRKHDDFKEQNIQKKASIEETHLCPLCGKVFNKAFSLTVHVRRHTGDKPYKCTSCDMRFVTSGRLTAHKRTHTGERPFKCKYCGNAFAYSTVLNTHLKSHLPVKPHKCSHCTMAFSTLSELNVHNRKHTGEKPFKCTICLKTFSCTKNLKQHSKTHTGEKPHLCGTCGKSFRRSHHLKNHMNIHVKGS